MLSRLRCNGHSLLLGSCLSRIGRIENPSCSACGHSPQDTTHLILHCPATNSLHCSLFGDSLSLFDLWSRPWGVARLLEVDSLPPCPISRKGSGNHNNNNSMTPQGSYGNVLLREVHKTTCLVSVLVNKMYCAENFLSGPFVSLFSYFKMDLTPSETRAFRPAASGDHSPAHAFSFLQEYFSCLPSS